MNSMGEVRRCVDIQSFQQVHSQPLGQEVSPEYSLPPHWPYSVEAAQRLKVVARTARSV